jgi:hypothetical protein
MKNLLFKLKAVKTGSYKAEVGAGAGVETNSFSSATLLIRSSKWQRVVFFLCVFNNRPNII